MRPGIHRLSLLWATALVLLAGHAGAQNTPGDAGAGVEAESLEPSDGVQARTARPRYLMR